jgi:transcriptional regulator with XRE-family HTH domain
LSAKFVPTPDPIDIHVGKLIRATRRRSAISQVALADAIGLTFQQIQKYELGHNRVSASKLFGIAQAIGVPVATFFADLEDPQASPSEIAEFANFLALTRSVELIKAYRHLSAEQRRVLVDLAQVMATS